MTVLYTIDFFRNVYSKIYINNLVLDGPPVLDLKDKNFVMFIKHNYPTSGQFFGLQDKFFTLKFHKIVQSPDTENPYEVNRIPTELVSCSEIKTDISRVNYSEDDVKSSLCVEFTDGFKIGGSFEKEETVSFLEILIVPCKVENPGDCEINHEGNMVSTVDQTTLVAEYFREYSLEVMYIEANHDVRNFDNPLVRNIGRQKFMFHSE